MDTSDFIVIESVHPINEGELCVYFCKSEKEEFNILYSSEKQS